MMLIKFNNTPREAVTKKGLNLGLDPKVTEYLDKVIKADTKGIIQPLHDTPRDIKVVDTDYMNGFVTIIVEDLEHKFKGFAERDFNGKTFRVETEPKLTLNECGRALQLYTKKIAEQLKFIN